MNASTVTSVVTGLVLMVSSSSERVSPDGLPKAELLEARFNWPSVKDVNQSGSSQLPLRGDGWMMIHWRFSPPPPKQNEQYLLPLHFASLYESVPSSFFHCI